MPVHTLNSDGPAIDPDRELDRPLICGEFRSSGPVVLSEASCYLLIGARIPIDEERFDSVTSHSASRDLCEFRNIGFSYGRELHII